MCVNGREGAKMRYIIKDIRPIGLLIYLSLASLGSVCSVLEDKAGVSTASNGYLPEVSTKEIKNNIKVFLTKMKVRRVPLATARTERLLSELYKEEREIKDEIEELEKNLSRAQATRRYKAAATPNYLTDLDSAPNVNPIVSRAQAKVKELSSYKIRELEEKKARLSGIEKKISDAKVILKNPENYIMVPSEYGADPQEQRNYERELLIRDRENMLYRNQIARQLVEAPFWMIDEF